MSTGFRLFLLVIVVGLAVWISRHRTADLAYWLAAPAGVRTTLEALDSSRSPVEEVHGPVVGVEIRSPAPEIRERPPLLPALPSALAGEPSFDGGYAAEYREEGYPPEEYPAEGRTPDAYYDPEPHGPDSWYVEGESYYPEEGGSWQDPGLEAEAFDGELREGYAGEGPVDPSEHAGEPVPPPDPETYEVYTVYTVRRNDTLSKISQNLLGRAMRWREILELNDDILDGKTRIRPGMKLKVPPR